MVANHLIDGIYFGINILGNYATISNNSIHFAVYDGIRLCEVYYATIIGNVIRDAWCPITPRRSHHVSIIGNVVEYARQHGAIYLEYGGSHIEIIGNDLCNCYGPGIQAEASYEQLTDVIIKGNAIIGNNTENVAEKGGIWIHGSNEKHHIMIVGNIIRDNKQQDIIVDSNSYGTVIMFNDFRNSTAPKIITDNGIGTIIKGNLGFVTENDGEATIAAGSTYVDVEHGLDITPDENRIRITPKDNLNGRNWWISDVNDTTFRINISSSDTVDHVFGWSYA